MQDLVTYLQGINDWETFGYLLLPKDKEHLVEVIDHVTVVELIK